MSDDNQVKNLDEARAMETEKKKFRLKVIIPRVLLASFPTLYLNNMFQKKLAMN